MPPRMGWDSQFGMVDEVTYGTPLTVARFLEMRNADVALDVENLEDDSLRAGRLNTHRSGAYARWRKGAAGDIEFRPKNKGFGLLFKHMFGAFSTGAAVTGAYPHTFSIASLVGDFFTCQISRGAQPHTLHGCKITDWEISAAVGELMNLSVSVDAEDEDTSTALATATYPTGLVPFSFLDGKLTVAGTETHIRSLTVSGSNNQKTDRYFIRQSGLKKEPIDQGREFTGELELDYEDQAIYDRFVNATEAAVVATFEGGVIGGSEKYSIILTLPVVRFDGETPPVEGADVIAMTAPFTILDESMTLLYKTTDPSP
jgi:hypothetical protein